eukprot:m.212173 g.212173  ORF g.212173 m.212173 type:complete len:79 (-) comp18583_c0_seq9:57-293(-)
MIDCSAWKRQHKYKHLGLPRMLGCITTSVGRQQYRVMALDRLGDSIHAAVKPHGPNAKVCRCARTDHMQVHACADGRA